MILELLKNFVAVANTGSITDTAEQRGLSISAVSKKLTALEKELGDIILCNRNPNGFSLTEEGLFVLPIAQKIIATIESLKGSLPEIQNAAHGPLKVLAMSSFGLSWFSGETIREFREKYPLIDLSVTYDNLKSFSVTTTHEGVFAGLATIEPRPETPYIWEKLASFCLYPFAHPSYLEKYGAPQTFEDLDKHKIIRLDYSSQFSYYVNDRQHNALQYLGRPSQNPREPYLTLDFHVAMCSALNAGIGIGLLPRFLTSSSELVEVMPDLFIPCEHGPRYNIYFVYPPHLKNNQRIHLLHEFLAEKIAETPDFWLR